MFAMLAFPQHAIRMREDHADCNDEQDDGAADAQRDRTQVQGGQEVLAEEHED